MVSLWACVFVLRGDLMNARFHGSQDYFKVRSPELTVVTNNSDCFHTTGQNPSAHLLILMTQLEAL